MADRGDDWEPSEDSVSVSSFEKVLLLYFYFIDFLANGLGGQVALVHL